MSERNELTREALIAAGNRAHGPEALSDWPQPVVMPQWVREMLVEKGGYAGKPDDWEYGVDAE